MDYPKRILQIAKAINDELVDAGISQRTTSANINIYDEVITNNSLRKKTEKLFKDGHHARAVEEAYKLLDNIVKKKAFSKQTDLTGASLMQTVFSQKKPLLKLNEGISTSEQNEQLGYMQMLSGCMTGIRNPRAHDSDWEDTEQRALQLIVFANHLIERVYMSERVKE